ncbi:C6 zinc finger domain-containing protein [Colletotrichum plurivorum]|uniref:C6 zinc finger domain-containing protein n=1 Tax=Colletotrichum plurivorum TaxID=2175906 RepID=A0A8H6JX39_9PEZI|nr:C6 zinc finger domain-containing protein [Colletotrichum plurivorum]
MSPEVDDTVGSLSPTNSRGDEDENTQHPRKRQRVRLSCLECRRRKLSCDRGYPCQRCLKSGTPDRCTYETKSGVVLNASSGVPPAFAQLDSRRNGELVMAGKEADITVMREAAKDHDRIRRLELEVAQLKNQLTRQAMSSFDGSTVAGTNSPHTQKDDIPDAAAEPCANNSQLQSCWHHSDGGDKSELRFFRGKEFRTRYFGPHNATMAFIEVSLQSSPESFRLFLEDTCLTSYQLTGLCPFMKETADEWLKPVKAHDRKDRKKRKEDRDKFFAQPDPHLEALLPPKEQVDALVEVYIDQFEQMHRIIHIPTFRREYSQFWENPSESRYAAFTALVLAIIAVANCIHTHDSLRFTGMISNAQTTAERWIKAVEEWQGNQSMKHRKLIHYQIACLLYLSKRVNTVKKKRFWTNSGALIQDGISVGLHREPSHMSGKISVYNQEMRRRIWATVQEFDMQASFDHGLPTLVSQLHYDVQPPRNLDDEDFDEDTTQLPPSKPGKEYTYSSYQNLARQSLPLRMELSRLLCGPPGEIDYDQVIRYTNDITHEIDSLPSWEHNNNNTHGGKRPLLAYTLLHIQLRQYIIPLHQPFLKLRKSNAKYQYSEIIYYNAARDIVLLHDKLYEQGIRSLNFLREDTLTTAVNLCSVTMLQPRGSTNMIMINSQHTVKLLEKCLTMKEDRLLRCGNNEPWGYSIMCSALGLLEAHLGTKTTEQAKASSAERFVQLHYKLLANQEPPVSSQQSELSKIPGLEVPERPKVSPTLCPPLKTASLLTRPLQSVTPFTFHGFPASQNTVDGLLPQPLPWMPTSIDPQVSLHADFSPALIADSLLAKAQSFNPDFSLEALGLNLNELWGESWDFS